MPKNTVLKFWLSVVIIAIILASLGQTSSKAATGSISPEGDKSTPVPSAPSGQPVLQFP